MGVPPAPEPTHVRDWAELLLSIGVVIFGAVVIWQTTQIRVTPAYSKVGPQAVPFIVGGGLVLVGLWLAFEAMTGRATAPTSDSEDADPTLPTDWRAVILLSIFLVLYLFLMIPAGFIIASGVLFAGAAFAMGSTRVVRNLAIGLIFAVAIYFAFTAGLGLRLPSGLLSGAL